MNDVTRRCSTCLVVQPEDNFGARRTFEVAGVKTYKPYKVCSKCRARKVGRHQRRPPKSTYEPGTRNCPQCGSTKPLEEFTGVRCTPCRDAVNLVHRLRAAEDPEYRTRKLQHTRDSNRRLGRVKASVGEVLDTTCVRCSTLFTYRLAKSRRRTLCDLCVKHKQEGLKYGLTGAQVEEMRSRPNCEICQTENPDKGGFKIDHCHATGVVRGMLCNSCNVMLGVAKDQPDLLRAAARYLERYRAIATGVVNAV